MTNMSAEQLHALKQQALSLLRGNRLDEAKALFSQVSEQNAEDVDAWYLLSCIHGMQGNMDEAGHCCRRVIALRPDHSDAHVNLGNVLLFQGKADEAVQHYQAALRFNPNNAGALCGLGNTQSSLGNHDEAILHYKAAVRLNPNFVEAYYNLGNSQIARRKYDDAIKSFRQVIRLNPNYAAAYNNLGIAQKQLGDVPAALDNYRTAIRLQPNFATAHNNLAIALKEQGLLEEAYETARQALRIQPTFADALFSLGNIHMELGQTDEAISCFQQALKANPQYAEAYNNLAMALLKQGKLEEAKQMMESALEINPEFAEALSNLADINRARGDTEIAIEQYRRAILARPDSADIYNKLGNALSDRRLIDEAVDCYQRAIALNPDSAILYSNLALAYRVQLRLDDAEKMAKKALNIQPDLVHAFNSLYNIYHTQGKTTEAIQMCREVLRIEPDNTLAHDNLLMSMPYLSEYTAENIYNSAREWGTQRASSDDSLPQPVNVADPRRRLRIGYVSGNFVTHPVGFFIEQVLAHHDKSRVEIFCYSNQMRDDDLTIRLRSRSDHWRNILCWSDEELAQKIRHDTIDILVDLAGHTSGNRLLGFAHKPAPVQATWIGYHATTGLPAMDYIIGDRYLIPPEEERYYVEHVLRLPNAYLCFSPPDVELTPGTLPALSSGKITFGCFNNPSKISETVIACWSKLLRILPQAQLYLKYKPFGDKDVRQRFQTLFAQHGIDVARIRFAGLSPRHEYLAAYQEVDLGLDPFPFNGCTTTMESLWMGVPVVTLRGDRYVGHMGETILKHLDLAECVTDSEEAYIDRAIALVSDLPRLAALRSGLRDRLLKSPLCDGPGFTRDLEAVYRRMWDTWCQTQAQPG